MKSVINIELNEIIYEKLNALNKGAAIETVVNGLKEHFENYDAKMNPDLENILEHYDENKERIFLVASYKGEVIATGALIKEFHNIGRIVRMSVNKVYRGRGIGRLIIAELEKLALSKGYKKILIETNHDWYEAIKLYIKCGYIKYKEKIGDVHFIKYL